MNRTTSRLAIVLLLLPILAAAGCSKDHDDNNGGPGLGTMQIRMTDAPAAYDAINLVVRQVAVRATTPADTDTVSGWQVIRSDSTTVNVIQLQNGTFITLGRGLVPTGTYTQIRLVLGAGSTIVVDGVVHPLEVPSGMQSGLKINGDFPVTNGNETDLVMDFDASRSIVETGNGRYILKPVIHVIPATSAGAIRGTVSPSSEHTAVTAMMGADTLGSAVSGSDGNWTISVLSAGTYTLMYDPSATFHDTTTAGVVVTAGATTNVGTMTLRPVTAPAGATH